MILGQLDSHMLKEKKREEKERRKRGRQACWKETGSVSHTIHKIQFKGIDKTRIHKKTLRRGQRDSTEGSCLPCMLMSLIWSLPLYMILWAPPEVSPKVTQGDPISPHQISWGKYSQSFTTGEIKTQLSHQWVGRGDEWYFAKEDSQPASRYMKKCSLSFVSKEFHIKMTIR